MGGLNGDALQKMIDGFNASQDEYQVRAIFQGGFVESLKKFVSSFGTDSMPAMIQLDDIQLRFMVDSEATVAPERFIEQDAAAADPSSLQIDLADIEPRAIDYYTLDGALRAMPFNLSGPVLYYDRSAFEEAGLDADRPPATLDEVRAYSERLLARDAEGAITRNGIALNISPWYFEQMMAKQGALYANNGNGREALATEVTFNGPQGEEILDWWGGMVEDGLATNVGRQGLQALLAVFTGKSAMAIESTAVMRSVLATLGAGAARFGAAPLPAPEGEGGGIVLGGAAVWITRDRPQEEQLGAWEFLKYATQPQVQAQWHFDTGYFPVSTTAWDLEPAATLHRDFPQFSAARQQVLDSPRNTVTAGAVIGPFTQVREGVSEAFERVLVGGETASEALERAAEEADRAIERYNRSVR
jgi:sn-glycerol 3-phosphate transport system substrate-binding protein